MSNALADDMLRRVWDGIGLSPGAAVMGAPKSTTDKGAPYVKIVNAYCPVAEGEAVPPAVHSSFEPELSAAVAVGGFVAGFADYGREHRKTGEIVIWRDLPSVTFGPVDSHPDAPVGFRIRARFCFEAP